MSSARDQPSEPNTPCSTPPGILKGGAMSIVSFAKRFIIPPEVRAHCDIPCGIYDPIQAKIAAQTVLKMVMRIQALALKQPAANAGAEERAAYGNTLTRYITVKERHAELFKREVDILWHDYFKPEHLQKHPNLHEVVWKATKLASANKQSVDLAAAKQLVETADTVATIFWQTKGVTYSDPVAAVRLGT